MRTFVAVDGGMGDNIRPALYDARYEAVAANRMTEPHDQVVTVAGKFCESGDILVRDAPLPPMAPGDLIAMPAAGAYAPSMASNYNLNARPPIALVKDGNARPESASGSRSRTCCAQSGSRPCGTSSGIRAWCVSWSGRASRTGSRPRISSSDRPTSARAPWPWPSPRR